MTHTTFVADRVFTGLHPELISNGAVTLSGEQIVYVGPAGDAPEGGERVELGDLTLMPGLIDMHVHLTFSGTETVVEDYLNDSDQMRLIRGVDNARRAIMAGITTVRECGGRNELVFALRDAARRGIIPAPRIIAAGGSITTTGGHCWFFGVEADSEDDLRRAVRGQVKAGADYIKIMATGGALTPRTNPVEPQYSQAQLEAVVEEANRLGKLRVSAHCHGTAGVLYAARAGVTTIEHCSFQTPNGYVYDEEAANAVVEAKCYVCPTIGIAERASQNVPADHRLAVMKRVMMPQRIANLKRLHERGVPFVSGSDAGVTLTPFQDFAYNVTILVDSVGMSPYEALQTTTTIAAEALARPDLGALEVGRAADVIAVRGNPLENINAIWDVEMVMGGGVRYR
ncbi:MAG TPA: amidohydrolase family protein [Roseiflexaceae bacterium]|nr:amidohydrolase family protein [Roseiflexaceae bacterium]